MVPKYTRALIVVSGIVLLLLFGGGLVATVYMGSRADTKPIEQIRANMLAPNKFYTGETTVGVKSVDDLGYILKSRVIELHYGKIVVNIPYKALSNKEYMDELSDIGINVYRRKIDDNSYEYRLTYWDEVIEEWAYYG